MEEASDHQRNVRQVLEGNERVWFHPTDDLLAVWHGGPQILIVSSRTFEQLDVMNVKAAGRDLSDIENSVNLKVANRGFDRRGRARKQTSVVEE